MLVFKISLNMFNIPNEKCWEIISEFHKGGVFKTYF